MHGWHLILKPGQNRLVKKLVGTQGQSPKNHDCPGKTSSDGQPVLADTNRACTYET